MGASIGPRWIAGLPYEIRWNGSATFHLYEDGRLVDTFTTMEAVSLVEAAELASERFAELERLYADL